MSLDDADVRRLRLLVREELERAESRRRGQRPPGQRRVRSPELRAPGFTISVSDRDHVGPCVYVLLLGGVVAYVGKTSVGFCSRAESHFTNRRFDTIVTLDLEAGIDEVDAWLFALENAVGTALKPSENSAMFRGDADRVAAFGPRIRDLMPGIQRACELAPAPRFIPRAETDLLSLVVRP